MKDGFAGKGLRNDEERRAYRQEMNEGRLGQRSDGQQMKKPIELKFSFQIKNFLPAISDFSVLQIKYHPDLPPTAILKPDLAHSGSFEARSGL